jgi:flavodoxin
MRGPQGVSALNTIVVFDSLHGNTERIAHAIGEAIEPLGQVRVLWTTEVPPDTAADAWVVGGPTQRHGMSPALASLVDGMPGGSLRGVPVATFDTRYHYPRLMSGSAAHSAAGHLRRTGCRLVTEPESFFVKEGDRPAGGGKPPAEAEHLEEGELERARAWGRRLATLLARP